MYTVGKPFRDNTHQRQVNLRSLPTEDVLTAALPAPPWSPPAKAVLFVFPSARVSPGPRTLCPGSGSSRWSPPAIASEPAGAPCYRHRPPPSGRPVSTPGAGSFAMEGDTALNGLPGVGFCHLSRHSGIVGATPPPVNAPTLPPRRKDGTRDGRSCPHISSEKTCSPHGRHGGNLAAGVPSMAVRTQYGPTAWDKHRLAWLHGGINPATAIRQQRKQEAVVVETFGPSMVGVRADQAAESLLGFVDRLHDMAALDRPSVKARLTYLFKLVNDGLAMKPLERGAARLASRPIGSGKAKRERITA